MFNHAHQAFILTAISAFAVPALADDCALAAKSATLAENADGAAAGTSPVCGLALVIAAAGDALFAAAAVVIPGTG
jgi:hypothetical protein